MLNLWPLLLPIAAMSGWFYGRSQRERGDEKALSKLSREYYVGLNYLLNEQPDKAVDVFIKLLEVDSETVETHLALGSLFRRRGEVDRAIRIHQNLIARPQLSLHQRTDALMALGRDYMGAGVLDRAERIFEEVVTLGGEQRPQALQYLLDIYQQEKSWLQAIDIAKKLEKYSSGDSSMIIAHHYCELAEIALGQKAYEQAKSHLKQALATHRDAVRASLLQAQIDVKLENFKPALKAFKRICWQDPEYLSEAIEPMMTCYEALGRVKEGEAYLKDLLSEHPRVSIILILAERLKNYEGMDAAADFVAQQLRIHPSVRGLNHLIQWHLDATHGKIRDKLEVLYEITNKLLNNKPVYRCGSCGYAGKHLHWQCPSCKQWSRMKPIHGLEGD